MQCCFTLIFPKGAVNKNLSYSWYLLRWLMTFRTPTQHPGNTFKAFPLYIYASLLITNLIMPTSWKPSRKAKACEPYHVFKCPKNGCCDNPQKQADDVEDCGGPQQSVQVKHILTAAHTKEFIVAGGLVWAERECRQCHCSRNGFAHNAEHYRICLLPACFPLWQSTTSMLPPKTAQNWRKPCWKTGSANASIKYNPINTNPSLADWWWLPAWILLYFLFSVSIQTHNLGIWMLPLSFSYQTQLA